MLHAFVQMNRYGRLAVEFEGPRDRFTLSRETDGLWLTDTRRNANDFPELTETTFGRMALPFGDVQFVKAVQITHPEPSYRAEYDRIFKAPITFGAERNALLLDDAWETCRLAPSPRYVFGILCERADALLTDLESSKSIRSRVESLLMPILHTGDVGMEIIASKMGLSRQTLFRRLKAEGVTFEKVLDELRYKLALGYLRGKKVSVNETAYLVGFSEPAAFSRAFKRWTGASPRNMRAAAARSAE
jgi:AraC-like DNA-binding protein